MVLESATEVADGLGFPEGPLVLPDGRVAFCEQYRSRVSILEDGQVRTLADVGGNPAGLVLGADGLIYTTRGPGKVATWLSDPQVTPAIVVIDPANDRWDVVTTSASGRPLRAPNDLCIGPDGALYFTDPDDFVPDDDLHGWICRHTADGTELRHELENTFPNGIAFDPNGRLVWTESHARRVIGETPDGGWEALAQLGDETIPDGCAYATDGSLMVGTLVSGGLDHVTWQAGEARSERIVWDPEVMPTNCAFGSSALYVTDVSSTWDKALDTGKLWRLETTLTGLPLLV